jgi:hypothetical protein
LSVNFIFISLITAGATNFSPSPLAKIKVLKKFKPSLLAALILIPIGIYGFIAYERTYNFYEENCDKYLVTIDTTYRATFGKNGTEQIVKFNDQDFYATISAIIYDAVDWHVFKKYVRKNNQVEILTIKEQFTNTKYPRVRELVGIKYAEVVVMDFTKVQTEYQSDRIFKYILFTFFIALGIFNIVWYSIKNKSK